MGYREPFTVYSRTLKSGKKIFYYQSYDKNGKRTTPRSTGKTTKSAAREFCRQLLKDGNLTPKSISTFADYAENWWIFDKCEYIKDALESGGRMGKNYASIQRGNLTKHILPTFGSMTFSEITAPKIKTWLRSFKQKNLSNNTANKNLSTLNIMLEEAVRRELIEENPASKVKALASNEKKRGTLTQKEVEHLFEHQEIRNIWDSELVYIICRTTASTGLRLGEIQGLMAENVFPDYLLIDKAWEKEFKELYWTRKSGQLP